MLLDLGALAHNLRDAFGTGERLLDVFPRGAQYADRLIEHLEIEEERHEILEGQHVSHGEPATEVDQDDHTEGG